jgi:hypothetical protein
MYEVLLIHLWIVKNVKLDGELINLLIIKLKLEKKSQIIMLEIKQKQKN